MRIDVQKGVKAYGDPTKITQAADIPIPNKIIDAPLIYQTVKYPTGCESVSTVMALQYAGINLSVDEFIDNYLPKSDFPFDPNITFGGNPKSIHAFGCYVPVIKTAVDKILSDKPYSAKVLSGVSLQELCSTYINKNIPVILWATMGMSAPYVGDSWTYSGKIFSGLFRNIACCLWGMTITTIFLMIRKNVPSRITKNQPWKRLM